MLPNSRTKDKQKNYWKTAASNYDRAISYVDKHFLASSRAWVCSRASGKTLEVAVGTGLNLAYYPQSADLYGLEFSRLMMQGALDKSAQLNLSVTYTQGNALALPYAEASFDTLVCTYALCGFEDERKALAEMQRVLKPGGRLLLADHIVSSNFLVRGVQHLLELYSIPAHGEHFRRRPLMHLPGLGFEVVETERLILGVIERVHARKKPAAGANVF
jgi:ubiquinone/menaquinone biosynthesis C-methylase UbiE